MASQIFKGSQSYMAFIGPDERSLWCGGEGQIDPAPLRWVKTGFLQPLRRNSSPPPTFCNDPQYFAIWMVPHTGDCCLKKHFYRCYECSVPSWWWFSKGRREQDSVSNCCSRIQNAWADLAKISSLSAPVAGGSSIWATEIKVNVSHDL